MIIGIAGTLGAGKGTVVEYLKQKGFAHYSSSDVLRKILHEQGLSADRAHLSSLANELLKKHEGGVLHFSHQLAITAGDQDYILEALHRLSEAEYIKKIGGVILGVDADIKTRFARISQRGDGEKDDVTYEQFLADSKREEEGGTESGPNIRAVMNTADFIISNDGSLAALHEQVDVFLKQLHNKSA